MTFYLKKEHEVFPFYWLISFIEKLKRWVLFSIGNLKNLSNVKIRTVGLVGYN